MAHLTRPDAPRCQVLLPMFGGTRGKVSLGRINSGSEAGRIVLLREVPEEALPRVASAVELAKNLSHPQLLKVLGVVSDQARSYIASEYIPGLSLAELVARTRAGGRGMEAGAAVRVIMDALRATATARRLLLEAGATPVRLMHSECVWLVDYGGTLLAEAGVSALLMASAVPTERDDPSDVEARDMMTAAVELYQLASARLMTGDLTRAVRLHLPSRLASLLEGVFTWVPSEAFSGVDAMADALSGLPTALVGSEALVAGELQRLCADLLDERRRKLSALRKGADTDAEGSTQVYAPPLPELEDGADEPTVAQPGSSSGSPFPAIPPPEAAKPRSSSRSRPGSSTLLSLRHLFALLERERRLVAFFALLALVVAIAWQRPDWFRNAAARLGAWSKSSPSYDQRNR